MVCVISEELLLLAGAFFLMGGTWLWTFRDWLRNPRRNPPRPWYAYSEEAFQPPRQQWDLQTLNRDYLAEELSPRDE